MTFRFAIRPLEGQKKTVVLGIITEDSLKDLELEPNRVYEVREILGTPGITDRGACSNPKTWGKDLNSIISCYAFEILMTKEELDSLMNR